MNSNESQLSNILGELKAIRAETRTNHDSIIEMQVEIKHLGKAVEAFGRTIDDRYTTLEKHNAIKKTVKAHSGVFMWGGSAVGLAIIGAIMKQVLK